MPTVAGREHTRVIGAQQDPVAVLPIDQNRIDHDPRQNESPAVSAIAGPVQTFGRSCVDDTGLGRIEADHPRSLGRSGDPVLDPLPPFTCIQRTIDP